MTRSGQSGRDAAGRFVGELASSLERESEGTPVPHAFPDWDDGSHFRLGKVIKR